MKAGWQTKTIGEVCEVVNGGTPKTGIKEFWNGVHLWITPAEMGKRTSPYVSETERQITDKGLGNSSAKLMPQESVILSSRAPIGYLVINTEPMAFNQGCKGLIPSGNLHYKYLYYYLVGKTDLLNSLGTGATFKELSGGKLKEVPIPIAPLPEQQRIVTILDEAFAGIATATANAEKNLANARELFESYLQSVFSNKGDGWKRASLGEVCTLKSGATVSASLEKTAGDLPYLKVADMNHAGNEIEIVSSSRFLNIADVGKNSVLPPGTTIFPKRGGSILTNKKRLTTVPICADLNIMGVIPSASLLPQFLFFYFLNVDMRLLGSGSSLPQINNYDIEPLLISYPKSLSEQQAIVVKFDVLSSETKKLEAIYQQKLIALNELKKSILNQAFSGQLQ